MMSAPVSWICDMIILYDANDADNYVKRYDSERAAKDALIAMLRRDWARVESEHNKKLSEK